MPRGLRCGAAFADITPYDLVPGVLLAGFENNRKAREVLEPLEAGAIYLTDGELHVVLVSLDLIGFLHPWVERVRDRLHGVVPQPENVLISSTHTHSGPDTIGLWGRSLFGMIPIFSGVDAGYMGRLVDAVAGVVREAVANPVQVTAKAAVFEVPGDWTRNDRKGGGKDDHGLVLAFDGPDGGRVATIVNFAAHPETLWEGNTLMSPDYPGAVRRRLREVSTGVPVFFSGALGGMVTPNVPEKAGLEERKKYVVRLGTDLGDVAHRAIEGSPVIDDMRLHCRKLPMELSLSNRRLRLAGRLGIIDREFLLDHVRTEMNLVRIGDSVSILTTPGEVTPELGRQIEERMSGDLKMIFCLGCDELGYVLIPEQFEDREYRYEQSMSIGPDTGPALLAATDRLFEDGHIG